MTTPTAEHRLDEARLHFNAHELTEAVAILEDLDQGPRHEPKIQSDISLLAGICYYHRRTDAVDIDRACWHFEELFDAAANDVRRGVALRLQGDCSRILRKHAKADALLKRSYELLSPSRSPVEQGATLVAMSRNDFDQGFTSFALAELELATRLLLHQPGSTEVLEFLIWKATIDILMNGGEDAERWLSQAETTMGTGSRFYQDGVRLVRALSDQPEKLREAAERFAI